MLFPELHCHSDPIHPGHHNIYNRQMNVLLLDNLQPFNAVRCLEYLVSLTLQIDLNTFPDFFVILYD